MDENESIGILLPQYMRCAVHTLNLVATTDADTAPDKDGNYEKHYQLAFGKAQALRNEHWYGKGLSYSLTMHENMYQRVIAIYFF